MHKATKDLLDQVTMFLMSTEPMTLQQSALWPKLRDTTNGLHNAFQGCGRAGV